MSVLHDIAERFARNRAYATFLKSRDSASLATFVQKTRMASEALPFGDSPFREALYALEQWPADDSANAQLLRGLGDYLLGASSSVNVEDWKGWLNSYQRSRQEVPIDSPRDVQVLLGAVRSGLVSALPGPSRSVLLGRLSSMLIGRVAAAGGDPTIEICDAVRQLALLTEVLPSKEARQCLSSWWKNLSIRPASLERISNLDALKAPFRGVGSPNGISVTVYHTRGANQPCRIVTAGRPPDPVLSSRIDDAFFSAALACDGEPTVLSSLGSVLSLAAPSSSFSRQNDEPRTMMAALPGIGGYAEPTAHVATVDMEADEVMLLVWDVLQELEIHSGLAKVVRWDIADGEELESLITSLLTKTSGTTAIRSDSHVGEEGAAIHVLPMLWRPPDGKIERAAIDFPEELLGKAGVVDLLRAVRSSYMKQLIQGARSREGVALRAVSDHEPIMKAWNAMSPEAQEAECRRVPTIPVGWQYDFVLGVHKRLPHVDYIERRKYEDTVRPSIVNDAKEFAQRFDSLARKLEDLDRPGGRADVLALKVLVDCALRGVGLPKSAAAFDKAYRRWAELAAPALWAGICRWSLESGYPLGDIAADNVVFNCKLSAAGRLQVEPCLLLDLHNYLIEVDSNRGFVRVLAGARQDSLESRIILDKQNGLTSAEDLHPLFARWIEEHPYPLQIEKAEDFGFVEASKQNAETRIPILLEFAKTLLAKGDFEKSRNVLRDIRSADEPAIYFLGAVSYLCGSDQLRARPEYPQVRRLTDAKHRHAAELNLAMQVILSGRNINILPTECRRYLEQLVERDPAFLGKIMHQTDLSSLMVTSALSSDQQQAVQTAKLSAAALELLYLAERVYGTAKALPIGGMISADVKRSLDEVCSGADSLVFSKEPAAARFDLLRQMLN